MRFGCCVALASFVPPTSGASQLNVRDAHQARLAALPPAMAVLEDAGCDFMEFGVGMVVPESPDTDFEALRDVVATSRLVPECFNSFIPPDLKLVGPDRDWSRIGRYVGSAAERVSALGGKVIVFGSGGARNVPDGFPRADAELQVVEFLNLAAGHARRNGISIAIEPLNRRESNILNSVAEADTMARRVDADEINVLVDFYHLDEEREAMSSIVDAGSRVTHVHVADAGRLHPGSGSYDYPSFFAALSAAGYDARISVECNWRDYASEAPKSIDFLRHAHAAAQAAR